MFWFFDCETLGILAHQPGMEPVPSALEGKVLTTGPGNPLGLHFRSSDPARQLAQSHPHPWIP